MKAIVAGLYIGTFISLVLVKMDLIEARNQASALQERVTCLESGGKWDPTGFEEASRRKGPRVYVGGCEEK